VQESKNGPTQQEVYHLPLWLMLILEIILSQVKKQLQGMLQKRESKKENRVLAKLKTWLALLLLWAILKVARWVLKRHLKHLRRINHG